MLKYNSYYKILSIFILDKPYLRSLSFGAMCILLEHRFCIFPSAFMMEPSRSKAFAIVGHLNAGQ